MFCIQDPSYENSKYLHETLLSECVGSTRGAGVYAFATKDGINLLLADDNFKDFLENGTYTLIVGTDDITNEISIKALQELKIKYGSHLIVKAYVHKGKGSTFHPKFSWFKKTDGGSFVLGSGNLTLKGLRHNREAYCVNNYGDREMQDAIAEWDKWLAHSKPFLFDIDDPIVLEKAKQNTVKIRAMSAAKASVKTDSKDDNNPLTEAYKNQPQNHFPTPTRVPCKARTQTENTVSGQEKESSLPITDEDLDIDSVYWLINSNSPILIAEIPNNNKRWQQANFNKDTFENYFGAVCGQNDGYRILLKCVKQDGTMRDTEIRPSVSVASRNYRFELQAGRGLDYPTGTERPIAVFGKVSCRDFIYTLLMPGDKNYTEIRNFIGKKAAPSTKMRRLQYIAKDVMADVPELVLWKRMEKEDH